MLRNLFLFGLVLFVNIFYSQTLSSSLDKQTLALGEVATYKVRITGLQAQPVQASPSMELLPFHFEEFKDSISLQPDVYIRIIEFAVFEEGVFTLPALEFKIGDEVKKTISYEVEVVNTAVKEDEINDIHDVKEVKLSYTDYWDLYKMYVYVALGVLALLLLIYFFRSYFIRKKSNPVVTSSKALKELENLRKKNYIERNDYRAFYVELIDITRRFIAQQYRIPADVLLTDDLISVMKETNSISERDEEMLQDVFLRGDLVKFAKTLPSPELMTTDLNSIQEFVRSSVAHLEIENLRTGV